MAAIPPHVRVGVGVFVLESSHEIPTNPRFLIGKRKGPHGAGSLALPGGHLEFGETLEECAAREVMEETTLKVVNLRFLTATNDIMQADNKHYVTMFLVGTRENDKDQPHVMEPLKCEGWEWVSWVDLVRWVKDEDAAVRKMFIPLVNLVQQRPGVLPSNA